MGRRLSGSTCKTSTIETVVHRRVLGGCRWYPSLLMSTYT